VFLFQVFMFIASIMQCLELKPGPEGLPDLDKPVLGLVMCVQPFTFIPKVLASF
jgi:hypothetical protein